MAARDVSGGGLAHHGGSSAFKQEGDRAGDKEDKEGERALRNGRKEVHLGILTLLLSVGKGKIV